MTDKLIKSFLPYFLILLFSFFSSNLALFNSHKLKLK